jgi:hemolysin III
MRGPVGWTLFGIVWALALAGIFKEIFRPKRGTHVTTAIYLIMGWLIIGFLYPLITSVSTHGLIMLLTGGILYSAGVIFYKWHSLKYHHAIWHLFVVGAAACQFFAILTLIR